MDPDRYLRLVWWAKRRYTTNGLLVLSIGFKLSAYRHIELAAWSRYMDTDSEKHVSRRRLSGRVTAGLVGR